MTITYPKDIVFTPVIYFKCKHKERMTCNNSGNCGVECHRTSSEISADSESVKIALEFFKRFRIVYVRDNDVIFSEIIENDNAEREVAWKSKS